MTSRLAVGSPEHRHLLSRFFRDSFVDYNPEGLSWPVLGDEELSRLARLPFWGQAVFTEAKTAGIVQRAVTLEPDPRCAKPLRCRASKRDATPG